MIPLKKQFPIKDGWLHLHLTLKRGVTFTEDDVRKYLAMFGGKDAVENKRILRSQGLNAKVVPVLYSEPTLL